MHGQPLSQRLTAYTPIMGLQTLWRHGTLCEILYSRHKRGNSGLGACDHGLGFVLALLSVASWEAASP
jgi:hypothetical protein